MEAEKPQKDMEGNQLGRISEGMAKKNSIEMEITLTEKTDSCRWNCTGEVKEADKQEYVIKGR